MRSVGFREGNHVSKSWDDLQSKGLHKYVGGPLTILVPSHKSMFKFLCCVRLHAWFGLVLVWLFGVVFFWEVV